MRTTLCFLLVAFSGLASVAKPQSSANSQQAVNINVASTAGVIPGYKAVAGSGLSLSLSAGTVFCNGTTQNYAGGSLPMTASAISYVYLDPTANCAPAVNTTGFTAGAIPIATVVTSISAITNVTDVRTISLGSGGGAGVGGCATNQFVTAINSGASPTCAQPAFSNLYGTAAVAQLPMATAASQGILQLAGDLAGNAATPTVTGLQGNPVSATTPGSNQVLQWNGTQWAPSTLPAGAGIGACAANQFVSAIYNGVAPTCLQPAFSNLSGAASASQLPSASSAAQGILQLSGDLGGNPTSPQIVSTHLASPLPIAQGGTGQTTATAAFNAFAPSTALGGLIVGTGANTYGNLTLGTSGQCLTSNGSTAVWGACGGSTTPGGANTQLQFNNGGAFAGASNFTYTSATGIVTLNQLANGDTALYGTRTTDNSPTGNFIDFQNAAANTDLFKVDAAGNVTATSFTSTTSGPFSLTGAEGTCSGAAAGKDVLCLGDATSHSAQLSLNGGAFVSIPQLAGDLSGSATAPQVVSTHLASPLPAAQGGSGAGNFTAHSVLVGEGSGTFGTAGPGTTGQCLISNGTSADPAFAPCPNGGGTPGGANTQLQFNNGGAFAGASNFTYASGTGLLTLNQLANGNDTFYGKRTTDSSPTGNLIHFQNAAGTADLFKVDALGNVTATSFTSTTSGSFSLTGAEGTCSGAAAGKDVLCLGDATSHSAQISLNGGAFVSIPQLAGDIGGSASAPTVVALQGHPLSTAAPASNQVLQWNGTQWIPSTLPSASSTTQGILQLAGDFGGTAAVPKVTATHLSSPLPIAQGGTGHNTASTAFNALAPVTAKGGVIVGTGTNTYGNLALGTSGQCLTSNGSTAVWGACGGSATPGGANTQLQFNNSGAFAGASNFTYASGTGLLTLNQLANGNDTLYGKRTTDNAPTGNLIHFQNAAGTADLFKVDALGNVTATSFTSTTSGPFSLTGAEGTCSGATAGKDVLCLGDTTSHSAQISLNGGAFVSIPQLAGDLSGSANAPQVVSTHLGHLNQNSANGDIAGTVSLSSATSASHTFSVTFNSAPICVLTPTSDPGSGQRYWVTTTATTVTANVSAAATITFNYHCTGNPN